MPVRFFYEFKMILTDLSIYWRGGKTVTISCFSVTRCNTRWVTSKNNFLNNNFKYFIYRMMTKKRWSKDGLIKKKLWGCRWASHPLAQNKYKSGRKKVQRGVYQGVVGGIRLVSLTCTVNFLKIATQWRQFLFYGCCYITETLK
jgi:hypothetical protein